MPLVPLGALGSLAGLQRLQYVFFYPQQNDIVIAGPAEGWLEDAAGHLTQLKIDARGQVV